MEFIEAIEETLGKEAIKNLLPMQPRDVPATRADVTDLIEAIVYQLHTPVKEGIEKSIVWCRLFYNV